MVSERSNVTDWDLERFALGELPAQHRVALQARIEEEPELAARLEAIRESDRRILADYPAGWMAERIRRRARPAAPGAMRWRLGVAVPALAMAVAALVVLLPTRGGVPVIDEEHTGIKGDPFLVAYRMRAGAAEPLQDGAAVSAGEVVQLHYVAARSRYGAIVSIDGGGAATLHWPESVELEGRLERQGEVALPHAFKLDDAPRFERFFFVTANEPVSARVALEAARASAGRPDARTRALQLPAGWRQSSLLLSKEGR